MVGVARARAAVALLLLAACLAAGGKSLRAQIPDSVRADTAVVDTTETPLYRLRGVTIAVPRPVSTTGGASAVELDLDSALVRPAPTLEQVLREMPLIQIRRNSRGEAQPALRGGEDRQIAVLMDGVPLTLGWDHRTDLSIIPLTAAQRVDLIRGLSSVLHGPNVLGGVVEVDVARGAERQTPPRPLEVNASVDHTGARMVGVSGGLLEETLTGEWIVRGGVGHQARDGLALPDGAPDENDMARDLLVGEENLRLNTDMERYDGFFSARFRNRGGRWMSVSASGFVTERGVAPEAHKTDPRLWRYPAQSRLITAVSGGTGQRSTPWGEGDLEASLGLDLGSTEIDQYATAEYDDVVGGEDADDLTFTLRLLGDHTLGEMGELRGALTYADVNHDEVLDGVDRNSYRQRLWSLGGEAEWGFSSLLGLPGTRETHLTLGASVDGADTPETGDKPDLGTLWDWGARVGVSSLTTREGLLFHGSLNRRTRFPALRELYSGALGRFVPNPDLRPEVLTGGEVGVTLDGSRAEIQVVGFHQRLADGIVRSSVTTPEGKKYKRINRDEIRSTGLEILASGRLGLLGWNGDLTLQKVRGYTDDGEEVELEYEPTLAGKVGVMAALPGDFVAGATARYMGEQYCENPEVGGLQSFDGSRHLDLSLSRVFGLKEDGSLSRAQARVSLENATDAVVLDQCGLPQPGRTLGLQLRIW
jgi:iron complex outermembrane receptor protein